MNTAYQQPRIKPAPLAHIPDAPGYRKWGTVYAPDTYRPMQGLMARSILHCARCLDTIPPGSLFTKHSIPFHGRLGPQAVCWHCVPFMVP